MSLGKVEDKSKELFLLIEEITKNFSRAISKIISESKKNFNINQNINSKIKHNILSIADKILLDHHFISGVGFTLYNDPTNKSWKMTWLHRPKYHPKAKINLFNKASNPLLDLQIFSWITKITDVKEGYLHGPYIDFVCNATSTVTYFYPIYFGQQLVGIAATDIWVSQFEQILRATSALESLPVVMTTSAGRVLFSNHQDYRVGDLKTDNVLIPYAQSQYFTLWIQADNDGAGPP